MNDIYQANTYRNGTDLGNYQSVFRKKTEKINWKKLAAVDVDRVTQYNDVSVLRDNIKHIAFCDLDAEMELRGGDRTLAKMFKMAQLMIDYLLSSQEHLAAAASEADDRCAALAEETDNIKRKLHDNEAFMSELKRECHRRKKLILAQQQIMDSGPETYHRCPYCVKAFLNGTFLQAHLEKRHSERYIRSMYLIDHKRDESPRKEHSRHDFHSSSEKRIEEMVRQFAEQRRESGDRNDEIDNMRQSMENMMRRQRDEMADVIHDLERRLEDALRREHKAQSHLGDLLDDTDNAPSQRAREEAVQKAVKERQRQKKARKSAETKVEQPIVAKRQPKQTPIQQSSSKQEYLSPTRQINQELVRKPDFVRDSVDGISIAESDVSNFGHMWDRNDQYRLQAREEVVNMLAEHLEHHGIKRTAPGISDAVLRDKSLVIDKEQKQLRIKYIDFADIRQRLVEEVEAEARSKQHGRDTSPKRSITVPILRKDSPTRSNVRVPSPQPRSKINEMKKGDRNVVSSESDWDERSGTNKYDYKMQQKPAIKRDNLVYEDSLDDLLRSPKRTPAQTNNARASSELSNSLNSSMWGPSDSKVTSVPPHGNTHKSNPTKMSTDLGNNSDSFDD